MRKANKLGGINKRAPRPSRRASPDTTPAPRSAAPDDDGAILGPSPSDDIPPHVWSLLQGAGEEAAHRLLELLQPVQFSALAGSVQRALIDLALTRAYGLPVRRSVTVALSSSDTDAVAASLAALADSLPERRAAPRDVTPRDDDNDPAENT